MAHYFLETMSHRFLRMLSQHPSHCLYKAANFCILVISHLDVDENKLNMMHDELKNLEEPCSNVRAADVANKQTSKSYRHVKLNVYDI